MATNPIKSEAAAFVSHEIDDIGNDWLSLVEWTETRDLDWKDEDELDQLLDQIEVYVKEFKSKLQSCLAKVVDGN